MIYDYRRALGRRNSFFGNTNIKYTALPSHKDYSLSEQCQLNIHILGNMAPKIQNFEITSN